MTHKKNWMVWAAVAAVLTAGALAWAPWASTSSGDPADAAALAAQGGASGAGPLVLMPRSPELVASGAGTGDAQAASGNPLDTIILPVFRATASGDLAMDPQTRVDVERIHALYERDEALGKLKEASSQLPARAQRELDELYQQYAQYSQAVAQTYPPGQGEESLDEATRQLAGLHELRRQYFGPERADAMFGEEEKTSGELLALMRKSKDSRLSLEERAAQAQDAWKKNQP